MKKSLLTLCFILSVVLCNAQNKEQEGLVKTRGRLDSEGKVIPGVAITNASVILKGGNMAVSEKDGKFSILLPEDKYYLQDVQKEGYIVVDQDILSKQYSYSKNPLVLVMEIPEQQIEDELAIERKIRRNLTRQLHEREDEIERLKKDNKISAEQYHAALNELYEDQKNNEKLISDMAERYSKIDFDQIDEFYVQVSNYILNGELTKADSMLNTKGNISSDIESLNHLKEVNAKERAELSKRQRKLEKSEAMAQYQLDDIAQRCYSKYEIFKMQHQNDSALYYLELRASLDTMNGQWMHETGKFAYIFVADYHKAMNYYQKALDIALDIYGEYHPEVANEYNNIGCIYEMFDDYKKALEYEERALKIQLITLGDSHIELKSTYSNLGVLYTNIGKYDEAMELYQKSVEIGLSHYGENHEEMVPSYLNIAVLYSIVGHYDESFTYYQKVLDILNNNIDEESKIFMDKCYNGIGAYYMRKGKYQESIEYIKKALDVRLTVYGNKHPLVGNSYGDLAAIYMAAENYEDALFCNEMAIKIKSRVFGDNHTELVGSYGIRGMIYMYMEKYDEALTYLNNSLEISVSVLGENNPDLLSIYERLGLLYEKRCEYEKSIECVQKSIDIGKAIYGENSINLASNYNNLGKSYHKVKEYDKAMENFKQSVLLMNEYFGEDNPNIGIIYKNIADVYKDKKEYDIAIDYYNKGLAILRNYFDDDYSNIQKILNSLEEINTK